MSRSYLLELCSSDDLSLSALQDEINRLGPRVSSSHNQLCFHLACKNKNVTLEIVQLLHSTWPGALRLRDDDGDLPIHYLCWNEDLDDNASIDILRFMLEIDLTLPREVDGDGSLPVHNAVAYKSTAFCKELIDKYPESLRIGSDGWLLIHFACSGDRDDTADTIQYMLELNTEIVNVEDSDGWLPIHYAAANGTTKSIELLLKYDPNAASKKTNDEHRLLPLHLACTNPNLSSIQGLYDAYPEAILSRNRDGRTPLDVVEGNQPISICQPGARYDSCDCS